MRRPGTLGPVPLTGARVIHRRPVNWLAVFMLALVLAVVVPIAYEAGGVLAKLAAALGGQ